MGKSKMSEAEEKESCTFRVSKSLPPSSRKAGDMCIVISPSFASLEQVLKLDFTGQEGVTVLIDKRRGERRKSKDPVSADRRKMERRTRKAELFEVVIAT